jgi:hypothetical protein
VVGLTGDQFEMDGAASSRRQRSRSTANEHPVLEGKKEKRFSMFAIFCGFDPELESEFRRKFYDDNARHQYLGLVILGVMNVLYGIHEIFAERACHIQIGQRLGYEGRHQKVDAYSSHLAVVSIRFSFGGFMLLKAGPPLYNYYYVLPKRLAHMTHGLRRSPHLSQLARIVNVALIIVIGFVNSIIPTICEGLADTKPGEKMPPNFSITSCLMVITFNSIVANSCGLRLIEVTLINMLTSGAWIGLSYTPVNPSVDMRMFMMFVIISIVLNFPPSYKKEMMQRKIFLIGKVTPAVS